MSDKLRKLKRVSTLHNAPVDGDGDGGLLASGTLVDEHRVAKVRSVKDAELGNVFSEDVCFHPPRRILANDETFDHDGKVDGAGSLGGTGKVGGCQVDGASSRHPSDESGVELDRLDVLDHPGRWWWCGAQ